MTSESRDRRSNPIVFGRPVVDDAAVAEVVDTLRSGWLGRGPKVTAFEAEFATAVQTVYACGTNSGSAGLYLALRALGIGPGDAVITTPLTFAATLHAIVNVGATPVLVDVEPTTMNLDPNLIAAAITPSTKAILPVHFAGRPCAMDEILATARERDLVVVEDAAHAAGSEYLGRPIGGWSDASVFSFQASKNLTTGDGGMVTTDRADVADAVHLLSTHGMSRDAWGQFQQTAASPPVALAAGFKHSLTDMQAALGIHQLRNLPAVNARRAELWDRYTVALAELPVTPPAPPDLGTVHARHLYTVLVDLEHLRHDRDEIRAAVRERGIGTGVHYVPAHLHPFYAQLLEYGPGAFPVAEWIGERTLSLPLNADLTDDDVDDVVAVLGNVLRDATV